MPTKSEKYLAELFVHALSRERISDNVAFLNFGRATAKSYRHGATIRWGDADDQNGVIGYDGVLETFFCQAFESGEDDVPLLWLGTCHAEYPTSDSLRLALNAAGASIVTGKFHGEEP